MHKLNMEFLGIEEQTTKDYKTYYYIHVISGLDSCKFYLTEDMKERLDILKPQKFALLECLFEIYPVSYTNNNYNQTCYALRLKGISNIVNLKKGDN